MFVEGIILIDIYNAVIDEQWDITLDEDEINHNRIDTTEPGLGGLN